jgi:hypothetical protein
MAVRAELALNPSRYLYARFMRSAPDVCMALVVIGVGVAGLTANCWLRRMVEPWIDIHLLFGALLCGWLTVRVRVRVKQSPCMQPSDIHEMSRQVSRIAYLVLYALIGIKLCIGIVTSVWSGGHSLLDAHFLNGPGDHLFDPKDDYQMCLAAGLIAMALVRVMVLRLSRRLRRQPLAR